MGAHTLRIGFLPLCDAAPLVVAKEEGIFEELGLNVILSREHSWAHIRDKLAVGDLDAAHMLSPMVVASALGLAPVVEKFSTAIGFNLNGNAITVSNALYEEMREIDPWAFDARPVKAVTLRDVAERRARDGRTPITFAMVYPFSSHNYLLRYWLSASGLNPDKDVRIIVVPPPDMVRLCEAESIDGFCVGEPWNTLAVHNGVGHQIVSGAEIWPAAPEKVLGVRRDWLDDHEDIHEKLLRSIIRALNTLKTKEGKARAIQYLTKSTYIGIDERHILRSLGPDAEKGLTPIFDPTLAGFPWHSKAAWIAMQMVRWKQGHYTADFADKIRLAFRTDLFRKAAAQENTRYPLVDGVKEGANSETWPLDEASKPIAMPDDRMIDGRVFDSENPDLYLEGLPKL